MIGVCFLQISPSCLSFQYQNQLAVDPHRFLTYLISSVLGEFVAFEGGFNWAQQRQRLVRIIILFINKNIDKMEKLVRYRKAFYEKENDLQHGNKKRERIFPDHSKSLNLQKNFMSQPQTVKPTKQINPQKRQNNTSAYCQLYADQLLNLPEYETTQKDFLRKHSIDGILRARMLDWMVEVTSSYKFSHKTYFDGVALMDRYFEGEEQSLPPSKLHLIGVQCMLIASKMQEVFPLKIKTVYEKIAHRKLSIADLVNTEERIMRILDYKLNSWTFFDIVMLKVSMYAKVNQQVGVVLRPIGENQQMEEDTQKEVKRLQQIASYLSKFVLYDYSFYVQYSTVMLAESVLKACFEISGILPPQDFFSCSPILIQLCKQRLLKGVKNHQAKFSGLNNIFRFTSNEIIALVEKHLD